MWSPNKSKNALTVALVLALASLARAAIGTGDRFPPLPAASGADAALPETRGRVVLVDFWASWCAPCKASFPAYARLHDEFARRGLVVIGVGVDDSRDEYVKFLRRHAPPFQTVLDQDKRLVSAVAIPAMPTSYLIGRDGRVRFIHEGFHSWETEKTLRAEIEALLNEK
jgi:thiol-disulfide isomerase/thioredoxin